MKDGVIQQCDAALEIYHRPKNRFVAGFLGSPSMNFFEGRLVKDGDALLFDEGTARVPVPDWARAELEPRAEAAVVLGVRPEAMSDRASARFATKENALPMRVALIQPLGDKMDVVLATSRHPHSVAHVDAHADIRVGETLPVFLDMDRVHFFAPDAVGERIVTRPGMRLGKE
jgi:multiple sugar transport system ATP-binding protein